MCLNTFIFHNYFYDIIQYTIFQEEKFLFFRDSIFDADSVEDELY